MDTKELLEKLDATIAALQELRAVLEKCDEGELSGVCEERLQYEARKILQEQGVSTSKPGFAELQDAICIVYQDPEKARRVSVPGGLYSLVAERHGKKQGSMQYSMRSAILNATNLTLPYEVPKFIGRAADMLREIINN